MTWLTGAGAQCTEAAVGWMGALLAGMICGAAAWGLGAVLSGTFEPFDSLAGFLATQVVLGGAAFAAAYRQGARSMLAVVLGGYLGLNLYAYALGGPESRAWALLGAITTLSLVVMPLLAGVAGMLAGRGARMR